jgi:hypothetical protein
MSTRTMRKWVLSGLAVIAVMYTEGSSSQAGSIGVKGHITPLPGGSPFLYEFELDLVNLSEGPITTGAMLTIGTPPSSPGGVVTDGLVGVNGLSGTQQPPSTGGDPTKFWILPPGGIVTSNTGQPPPFNQESSVTWTYLLGANYSQVGKIGLFTVETASDFPDNMPPVTPGVTPISYKFTFADGTVDSGTITLSLIPEPSSVIMLLVGIAALPLALRCSGSSRSAK